MKKLLIVLAALLALVSCRKSPADIPHPRLIIDKEAMENIRAAVAKGENAPLVSLHEACLEYAENTLALPPVEYKKDVSNKRILAQSRLALARILSESYAFRFTGEGRFLDRAELELRTVCGFVDWNPSHFLDVGEMALAVAIGYDWLYDELSDQMRDKILFALREFAFAPSKDYDYAWFYRRQNNWNQVCNAGLICAAIATWESNPEESRALVDRMPDGNRETMTLSYTPDGNYAEGPGYWEYGTMFEAIMLTVLESCLGTDFGLGGIEGFDKTPYYILYSVGTTGKNYNYYDNGWIGIPHSAMWYFAAREDDPSLLYRELQMMEAGEYGPRKNLLFPLLIYFASKIDFTAVAPPAAPLYYGRGETPVVMVRTGWDNPMKDSYLALKGGKAITNHGHMDVGSFVYDACGIRWAMDFGSQYYAPVEAAFKPLGLQFWDKKQDAGRWLLFRYNNRQHNTLTINGHDHLITGFAPLVDVYESGDRLGGCVDISAAFGEDLEKAVRGISLRRESPGSDWYLEVCDTLAAPAGAPAAVRWTMVSEAAPTVVPGGILLEKDGYKMLLSCSGASVKYRTWPSDPLAYDSPVAHIDAPNPGTAICGFEFTLPAGSSVEICTTLKIIE